MKTIDTMIIIGYIMIIEMIKTIRTMIIKEATTMKTYKISYRDKEEYFDSKYEALDRANDLIKSETVKAEEIKVIFEPYV